jgi:hypothetical protein
MYRLVSITLEEYRFLFDAGVWVYGDDTRKGDWILQHRSDTEAPVLRDVNWEYCYTRVEQEQP